MYTATYSPDDNKLRLTSSTRLDKELYLRVKELGFKWAPKQEAFIAPMWTPEREDLCLELAGEIEDEDKSLVERAEERAERFEQYSDNREADAHRAHEAVKSIADGIPLGQPILVGHHSEKHARRDAQKIENGMRRAVKLWETSKYWAQRAAGAIRHAKYKELPAVRARRIKTLEADLRQCQGRYTPLEGHRPIMQYRWNDHKNEGPVIEHVYCGTKGASRGGCWVATEDLPRIKASMERWEAHYTNRIAYEKAMLAENGGLQADAFDIQVGGKVSTGSTWYVVTKLNKKDGVLNSVSVIGRWCMTVPVEEIRDYREPEEGEAEKLKAAMKAPPLVNFRSEGCREMTSEQWKKAQTYSDTYFVYTFGANTEHGPYRHRTCIKGGGNWDRIPVFLTDAKVTPAPPLADPKPKLEIVLPERIVPEQTYREPEQPTAFDAMKESLKAGVQTVSAPQLFPTPRDLAARMVDLAELQSGCRVLEPSAGTGRIIDALDTVIGLSVVAVELSCTLSDNLKSRTGSRCQVIQDDFLECGSSLGLFDAILMNPPFANGADMKHIRHAVQFLKPGGRLVAICANGPRQQENLRDGLVSELGGDWQELPAGTFEQSGTGVRTALLRITKAKATAPLSEPKQVSLFDEVFA